MSLLGTTKIKEALIGNIHILKKIAGYSAYEIAVKNGYKGTEKEWLESIRGKDGDKGAPGVLENHSGIDALNQPIVNVADPTNDTDAVNKKYVDAKDITDNFATMLDGSTKDAMSRVYKIGTLIHCSLTVKMRAKKFMQINEAYLPTDGNAFSWLVTDADEFKGLGLFALNPNTGEITLISPSLADIGSEPIAHVNFTYICK